MTSVVTNDQCRDAILDYLRSRPHQIALQFTDDVNNFNDQIGIYDASQNNNWKILKTLAEVNAVGLTKTNWLFMDRRPAPFHKQGVTEISFDCEPFDNQIRAYVYEQNGEIINIEVIGE